MTLAQNAQYAFKNLVERIAAAAGLLLLSPALVLIALLVRVDSPGPSLFWQQRIGRRGKHFWLVKFRTMRTDAHRLVDEAGRPTASRVTALGRFLRGASLDELPQLWNIARGEMALIGPRPLMPEHLYRCAHAPSRHDVLPGITGLAQVSGRNTLPWSRRIELDVEYARGYSLFLDAKVLVETFRVVALGSGVVLDRNPEQVDDLANPAHEPGMVKYAGRVEPVLRGAFAKDRKHEDILASINEALAPSHDAALQELPETWPTIHVIGAPRSGTTLATQLIANGLSVGYINQLTAAFWKAPVYGLELSKKLLPDTAPDSFDSEFGRTNGINGPHEFGYFWTNLLGYPELRQQPESFERSIDWGRFRKVLLNMQHAAGRPMLFKSFLLCWHLRRVLEAMPQTVFVWTRRDPVENARSILKTRAKLLGSEAAWVGLKPKEYEWLRHEPAEVQAAGQVTFIERTIRESAPLLGNALIEVDQRWMVEHPSEFIQRLRSALRDRGCDVVERAVAKPVTLRPPQSDSRDRRERLEEAFSQLHHRTSVSKAA